MKKIILARIDDRLIHGQVVAAWLKQTNANKILVIDDTVANDPTNCRILKATCPAGVKLAVYTVDQAETYLKGAPNEGDKLMVITKTPLPFEELVNRGVDIKSIVLGGMGAKEGRTKFIRNCSASKEEIQSMKKMIDKGISIRFQLVPTEMSVDVSTLVN